MSNRGSLSASIRAASPSFSYLSPARKSVLARTTTPWGSAGLFAFFFRFPTRTLDVWVVCVSPFPSDCHLPSSAPATNYQTPWICPVTHRIDLRVGRFRTPEQSFPRLKGAGLAVWFQQAELSPAVRMAGFLKIDVNRTHSMTCWRVQLLAIPPPEIGMP
jgi:hypothetical protein